MKQLLIYACFLGGSFWVTNCKSQEQIEADRLSGGWNITQVTYAQRGSTQLDSTVSYTKAVFDFGGCKLSSAVRECYGYYTLNGQDRTAISYGPVKNNSLFFTTVDQKNKRGIDLTGSFFIEKVNERTMILSGPGSYVDAMGKFHLQAQDVKLSLSR